MPDTNTLLAPSWCLVTGLEADSGASELLTCFDGCTSDSPVVGVVTGLTVGGACGAGAFTGLLVGTMVGVLVWR